MAAVQVCVKLVTVQAGTGTQSVTGVVDHLNSPFTPTAFLVFGNATLNTVETFWRVTSGFDNGVSGYGYGSGESNDSGGKIIRNGYGNRSIYAPLENIFGGNARVAYITNVASGSFDVVLTTNAYNGDVVVIVCLGGSELQALVTTATGTAKQTTTFQPAVALFQNQPGASTPSSGPSAYPSWGFATSDGNQGVVALASNNVGGHGRYQRTTKALAVLNSTPAVASEYSVDSWQSDGLTLSSSPGTGFAMAAFGGCSAASGATTQPVATGTQTIATGIKARLFLVLSYGYTAGTSVRTDESAISWGMADGTRQAGYWTSEDASGSPLHGARYLSNADVLLFAIPNAGSSTIHSRAQVTDMDPLTGDVTLNWSVVDGTARQFLWLAIGEAVGSDPPVAYEDPCSIEEPRIFATVTTETETIKIGVQPLRDSAALGGYAEPRLIDVSPVTRVASDVATGAWSAQTAAWKWADTDRANRARSATRTSFRGCAAELYLTSNAQRLAGLPPRVLFAGTVYGDSADENLVLSTTINDLIGSNYSLFSEEKQIPQRVIEKNWFPNAPDAALGQAEPIVGGRRAPLDPHALAAATLPEGVSKGVYVGQVRIGGAHGTPTGGDLATVVAALEASRAAGTLYTDYGSRIGYSDATVLQGYSSVPSDYDALAQVIGYGDLDALIAETAHTGGDLFEAVVIGSHAIAEVLDGFNGDPSIWVGDTQVAAADIGTSVWCPQIPGDTSWASDIGSDLFTDIVGADGTTRRYTLVLFDPGSAHGLAVAGGAVVHVDCIGLEDVGDGTGAAITDAFSLYRHLLDNFILQDYQAGAWLASPQFLFSDGVTLLDRVDAESFATASTIAALNVTGGYVGSFTIDSRVSVRDIVANCNLSWGCLLAQDDYQRLTVKVFDTRRANFLTGRYTGTAHRTLDGKRDILPGFRIDAKPDWQVNKLTYQYAKNNYTGSYERDAGGGGNTVFVEDVTSQERDGVIKKTVEFAYVRDDATADAVAAYYLSLFKDLPRVVTYTRRGLCGLEDDLLDGVPITHWNGYGANGWVDHSVWIIGKTFDPKRMACTFTALDAERVLVEAETADTVYLASDPVALEYLLADDGSGAYLTEG